MKNDNELMTASGYLADKCDCELEHLDAWFANRMHDMAATELSEQWDDELEVRVYFRKDLDWVCQQVQELAVEEGRA